MKTKQNKKTFNKLGVKGSFLNLMKYIYRNSFLDMPRNDESQIWISDKDALYNYFYLTSHWKT